MYNSKCELPLGNWKQVDITSNWKNTGRHVNDSSENKNTCTLCCGTDTCVQFRITSTPPWRSYVRCDVTSWVADNCRTRACTRDRLGLSGITVFSCLLFFIEGALQSLIESSVYLVTLYIIFFIFALVAFCYPCFLNT